MNNQEIKVFYNWTAKPGNGDELKKIYQEVTKQMEETEPNAFRVECFYDQDQNRLVVFDLFKDSEALGLHLSTTAAGHFPNLLQIANPGSFIFCGDVPQPLQEAINGMGLKATFASKVFGFNRILD